MHIVILDGLTTNPGDLSWDAVERQGTLTVFDRTTSADVVGRAALLGIFAFKKPVISAR